MLIQVKIYHCDEAIYGGGGRFSPKGGRLALSSEIDEVVSVLWYHTFYDENICISRIRRVFGHGSISKSFINWL